MSCDVSEYIHSLTEHKASRKVKGPTLSKNVPRVGLWSDFGKIRAAEGWSFSQACVLWATQSIIACPAWSVPNCE